MTMKYRKLGNSGLSVSNLILGTMGFGTETPEQEAFAILDAFLEAGGNMIDTADVYGGGASEELLGRWRASRPDTTKWFIRQVMRPWAGARCRAFGGGDAAAAVP